MLRLVLALLLPLAADGFAATAPQRASRRAGNVLAIGNFFSFGGGGRGETEFLKLSADERVAMAKVARCIAPGEGEGPLGKPAFRPQWANPTNETWSEVRADYPVLESLSDETIAQCLLDIKAMQ